MVVGIGIDIVSPKKVEQTISKWGNDFIDRVFNPEEVNPLSQGKVYYQRLAARFAAKEAIIKALGKNFNLALKDILITNLPSGAPVCAFKQDIGLDVFISISHIEEYAISVAVAQQRKKT